MTTMHHICNREDPQLPCCWAARRAEFNRLKAADAARMSKYGSLSCPGCGKIYRVVDGVVEDHICQPITARGFAARGID